MNLFTALLRDECGFVLSAESVLLGTVGVIGATVGLSAVATSVNEELTDVAKAIRSVDQSYHYHGMSGCGSCVAGSSYTQQPVAESLKELEAEIVKAKTEEAERQKAEEGKPQPEAVEGKKKAPEAKAKAREEKRRKAREARERERNQDGESPPNKQHPETDAPRDEKPE